MKRTAVIATLFVSLVAGSAAMAGQGFRGQVQESRGHADQGHANQGRENPVQQNRSDRREPVRSAQHFQRDHDSVRDNNWRDNRGRDDRYRPAPQTRYVYRPAPPRYGFYNPPRGYFAHSWRRGERLPAAYYSRPYVIADYRDCGLRAPPRGYHWVRVNNDAVLAAVATGVVLESVFHLF